MRVLGLLAAVLLSGCGGGSPTAAQSPASAAASQPPATPVTTPTPLTQPTSLLVAIGPGAFGSGQPSSVELVNAAGKILAKATSKPRYEGNVVAPWISVTASRVYYLDGPSDIRWLKPDGNTGLATNIPVLSRQQVSFAVSADDQRLAVSVLSYGPKPTCGSPCLLPPPFLGMRLDVSDSAGGNRTTIFTSKKLAEVPVGWNAGNLVVGVVPPNCCQAFGPNPFSVSEYHVVNPANANRLWTICPAPTFSLGHPQTQGTLCGTGRPNSPLTWQSWNGKSASSGMTPAEFTGAAFLAPDAQRFALGVGGILVSQIGGGPQQYVAVGSMLGWLDSNHLAAFRGGSSPDVVLVDLRKSMSGRGPDLEGALTPLPTMNIVVGVFPGGLE